MWASLKNLKIARTEGHRIINTKFNGKDLDTQKQSNGLLLSDFEKNLQKQNSRDAALLTERICGICPICDPLHCLLVVLFDRDWHNGAESLAIEYFRRNQRGE